MYEDINCEVCNQSNWTHESIGKEEWITCKCGHEEEVKEQ